MMSEKDSLGGFLILGFALFIAGFLTGMLALAVLHVSSDLTSLSLMIFGLGFAVGIIVFALASALVRLRKKPNHSQE